MSPRRPASRDSSSSCPGGSCISTTSPSGSPVAVRPERSTSVAYRLSRPTSHGASRVAAPDRTSSRPDAKGSSVPAWPVRAPVRLRICAITWNDEGPAGLSTSRSPLGRSARGGTRELPAGELDDLFDALVGRESGRALVAAAAAPTGHDRYVEGVDRGAHRDAPGRPVRDGRLADRHRELDALD